jgi:TPR repeat protein
MTSPKAGATTRSAGRGRFLLGFRRLTAGASFLEQAARLTAQGNASAAFTLLARAARAGNLEAEYRVGRCYLYGTGVPASHREAAYWLGRSADRNHPDAQCALALLHLQGGSSGQGSPDFAAAVTWARRGAEGGSAEAQALLAYILSCGPEALRDPAAARRWYARSAAAGWPQGALGHGLAILHQAESEGDRQEAARQIGIAAAAGLAAAMHLLAGLTERGIGVARDPAAAAELYRRAALLGHRPAQTAWGRALLGAIGVERDPVEGESWLRRAALAGDADAAAAVAEIYADGGPLPANHAEAAIWYRRAAEGGHPGAARALASIHLAGLGQAQDEREAGRWLRVAAEAGDPQARIELAGFQLSGIVAADDPALALARSWLLEAAQAGSAAAAVQYGKCLALGIGMERDEPQALHWMRRAAEGSAEAQYWYGRMLAEGRGTAADAAAGRSWIVRAAALGLTDAEAMLGEMMVNGRGGARDEDAGKALLEAAAAKGHAGAMFALAIVHDGAFETAADRETARRWLQAAADHGHPEAKRRLGHDQDKGQAAGA